MSNEQYPNPWSREGATPERQWPQAQPQTAAAGAQQGPQPTQSGPTPTQPTPSTQPSAPRVDPTRQQPPFATWNPAPQSAFGQPSSTVPAPAPKAKGRSRLAGALAVALLAAGVGGGAGFAATQFAQPPAGSASSTAGTTTSADQGGVQTTVVQADPSNPDWTAVASAASKSVVAIDVVTQSGGGQGSGVVIDSKGHIVTNNHVVSGATGGQVRVLLGNVSYDATIVGTDPSTDLAVIKLTDPPKDLNVMQFADSTAVKVGDPVMAIGNPLGLADTVTTGIVSALNRPVTTSAASEQQGNQLTRQTTSDTVVTAAIQTNAAINPGNSGGALVDTSGKLVGITSSIASLSSGQGQAGNIGIGFAIGSDQVKYVADQLIATGKAEHPQLGITAGDVTETGQQGAVVGQVTPGSAAEKAGLRADDVITSVNGLPVSGSESLVALVRASQVGQPMTLTVIRNGSEEKVEATPTAATA